MYKDSIEDPKKLKASEIQHVTEVNTKKMHTLDSILLCAEQMWDITCKNELLNPIVVIKIPPTQ